MIESYESLSGDTVSDALKGFYRSHRATTRAKVVAWHRLDPAYRDRADWPADAERYLGIAEAAAGSELLRAG